MGQEKQLLHITAHSEFCFRISKLGNALTSNNSFEVFCHTTAHRIQDGGFQGGGVHAGQLRRRLPTWHWRLCIDLLHCHLLKKSSLRSSMLIVHHACQQHGKDTVVECRNKMVVYFWPSSAVSTMVAALTGRGLHDAMQHVLQHDRLQCLTL